MGNSGLRNATNWQMRKSGLWADTVGDGSLTPVELQCLLVYTRTVGGDGLSKVQDPRLGVSMAEELWGFPF